MNGHSDVVGGCVVTREKSQDEKIAYIVMLWAWDALFDAWLVLRESKL
ncbi:MAG: hypothetical protein R3C11_06105 [Planctomycetaceae bacterium]